MTIVQATVCLSRCSFVLESVDPWLVHKGPVDVCIEKGSVRIGSCRECGSVIDCEGALAAIPCPFNALVNLKTDGEWLDEVLRAPAEEIPRGVSETLLELGYCGALFYARRASTPPGFMGLTPGAIVEPDGIVEGSGEPILALVALSRRTVYTWKSRHGVFPVEWLDKRGLLAGNTVVVGSWVSSWEASLLREKNGILVLMPLMQAVYRGGLPPRPDLGVNVALGTGHILVSPWALALTAYTAWAQAYWGRVEPLSVFSGLYAGWRLAGLKPRIGEVPALIVSFEHEPEEVEPLGLLTAEPKRRLTIWV